MMVVVEKGNQKRDFLNKPSKGSFVSSHLKLFGEFDLVRYNIFKAY